MISMSEDNTDPAAAQQQLQQGLSMPPSATFMIQPPEPFNFAKPQEWEKWIQRFERFRLASNLHVSSQANQVNTLLHGRRGRRCVKRTAFIGGAAAGVQNG